VPQVAVSSPGDAIICQSNDGIRFFGISLFARIG
jgi:hypothetical protein